METMETETMGRFIAALRKERGLTQRALAEGLHITDKAVSKWERGLSCPDISLLQPLAEQLGVTVGELLAGRRSAPVPESEPAEALVSRALEYAAESARDWRRALRRWCLWGCSLALLKSGIAPLPEMVSVPAFVRFQERPPSRIPDATDTLASGSSGGI